MNAHRYRLALSVLLILVVVIPWQGYQDHSHWDAVRWVPFVSPPVRLGDILGNIFLYVPFGLFYARGHRRAHVWMHGLAWALLLAGATEFTQVFSHGRFPSVQDILMNVLGAACGIALSGRKKLRRPTGSPTSP